MIAFVDEAPRIELDGQHFRVTVTSGTEELQSQLTAKALNDLRLPCERAYARRRLAELEAHEKIVDFPKPAKKRTLLC